MEDILLEVKENVLNRYLKIHAEHPLAEKKPEVFKDAVRFGAEHGTSHAERTTAGQWALDGHLKHKGDEDAPTIRNAFGRIKSATSAGLIDKGHDVSQYKSPAELHSHMDELGHKWGASSGSPKEQKIMNDYKDHHIGSIYSKEHGPLDVYNFHMDTHGEKRIDQAQKEFLKPSCGKNAAWCVASDPQYFRDYSQGHGFNLYTKKGTAQAVLGHGNDDTGGIKDKQNNDAEGQESIIKSTHELLQNHEVHGSSHQALQYAHSHNLKPSNENLLKHMEDNPDYIAPFLVGSEDGYDGDEDGHPLDLAVKGNAKTALAALNHPSSKEDQADHVPYMAAHHSSPKVVRAALEHETSSHSTRTNAYDWLVAHNALHNKKLSNALMAYNHPNISLERESHLHSTLTSPHHEIVKLGMDSEHYDPEEHLQYVLRGSHVPTVQSAMNSEHFNSDEHLGEISSNRNPQIAQMAIDHPDTDDKHLERIAGNHGNNLKMMQKILKHPWASENTLDNMLYSNPYQPFSVIKSILNHPEYSDVVGNTLSSRLGGKSLKPKEQQYVVKSLLDNASRDGHKALLINLIPPWEVLHPESVGEIIQHDRTGDGDRARVSALLQYITRLNPPTTKKQQTKWNKIEMDIANHPEAEPESLNNVIEHSTNKKALAVAEKRLKNEFGYDDDDIANIGEY